MLKIDLNGTWKLNMSGRDAEVIPAEGIDAKVPGSVYEAMLEHELIPDPYYRDNELKVLPLMDYDFSYTRNFQMTKEMRSFDALLLRFEGIDTLADIYLNGEFLGCAYNMHRIWEYELLSSDGLHDGENQLKVVLHSPTKYIEEENKKVYTGGTPDAMEGFPHLRKAHCMFGWDWGPRLPDAGIFRDVSLLGIEKSRFDSVYITQEHENGKVLLDFDITLETFGEQDGTGFWEAEQEGYIKITVTSPEGKEYIVQDQPGCEPEEQDYRILIEDPRLWWPNGYGEQPLYQVKIQLLDEDGTLLDLWQRRIGLRTMTVNTEKDEWGNCFAHEVNGVKIFAMGADYIPEDNLLGRVTPQRTRKLLEDAVWANHNCIRVWGGGYYPDDLGA